MNEFLNFTLVDVSYETIGLFQIFYFGFNSIEALAWFAFSIFVLFRYSKNRKSKIEILYSVSFLLFGVTDLLELNKLPIWLLLIKGVVLVSLVYFRHQIVTKIYPNAKF